jgi:CHAT domain-containing protein
VKNALLALLCAALTACSGGRGLRPVLPEFRAVAPRQQVVEPAWLATFTTDELYGRLSPDGRRLAYAGNQKGNLDIWVKDLTTGMPERISSFEAEETQPAWGPAGKRLVFVSMHKDVKGDLYLWDDDELTRLTDPTTEDSYPTFAPDGAAVYFAAGPEGISRIERLILKSKERKPITGWRATHPAVSPDGRYLAFTQFDADERGRIAVIELVRPKQVRLVTAGAYHAGFPAFSADGRTLYFSRFTASTPHKPLKKGAVASLWQVDLRRALRAGGEGDGLAEPLTSGRYTVLFAQHVSAGIVFTTSRAGSLDIGLLPAAGPVPRLATAEAQLALARRLTDPDDRLLCLRYVHTPRTGQKRSGAAATQARYLEATLHRERGAFAWAKLILERLVKESPMRHGDTAYMAMIDAALLELEQRRRRAERSSKVVKRAVVRRAEQALGAVKLPTSPAPRVAAHLLLRRGDLHRLSGQRQAALRSYEELVRRYPTQRTHAVEAKFRLGGLFAPVRDPRLLADYYLTLFADYPQELTWLRRTADAVLALFRSTEPAVEVEDLRALMDANRDKPLLWARIQMRLGRLFEQQGRLDLAIEAMDQVTRTIKAHALARERTTAAFELGRLSLAQYEQLREAGRLSEALSSYDRALKAYAGVVKAYQPGHAYHTRARAEFLRLSLLMAAQLEREGERVLAEKRYAKILELDPDSLPAHRKLIQLGLARGQHAALERRYEARLDKDATDPVGHYGLGYLATFATPVTASSLNAAEKHLRRAIDLNPRSPFGYMTLGWIYEMRERLLRQLARGHLEEALLLYDRAYKLNDAKLDVQTEADLLVNQCNAFADLGNGWLQAFKYCSKREALKIPFISRLRAATFHITFGRAATAMDHQDVAERQLQRALDLAQELKKPALEAEATARLALAAHLAGDFDRSTRYFRRAMDLLKKQGQTRTLASLHRSVAVNLALSRQHGAVLDQVLLTEQALRQHGTVPIEKFMPLGNPGRSASPYGLWGADELYLSLALKDGVYRARRAWREVAALAKLRLANRQQAQKDKARDKEELERELLQLKADQALVQLRLGHEAAFFSGLEQGLASLEKMQTIEKEGYVPSEDLFPLQVALTLNRAERILARLAAGRPLAPAALEEALGQVQRLEWLRRFQIHKDKKLKRLLSQRLRLALWSDLALLRFHAGLRGLPAPTPPPDKTTPTPPPSKVNMNAPAARTLTRLQGRAKLLVGAVTLLRQVLVEVDPSRLMELQESNAAAEERANALKHGTLAPLWLPLTPAERLRWYALTGLNLAGVAAAATPRNKLAAHPSTKLLEALTAAGLQHDTGALRFAAAAALADRNDDPKAMAAAVGGYLGRSPLLLSHADLRASGRLGQQIFSRAVALSLRHKDLPAALAYAEQRERRGFVDALVLHGPRGWGRAAAAVRALVASSRRYRSHLARQDLDHNEEARKRWQAGLNKLEHGVAAKLKALRAAAPRVADLFVVGEFPLAELVKALAPDDVAVTALVHGGKVQLVALRPGKEPSARPLKQDLAALRRLARKDPAALARSVAPTLRALTGDARRAYVDLGQISAELNPAALLPKKSVARLATLWELVDAHRVRNVAFSGALVADPTALTAEGLARQLKARHLGGKKLTRAATGRAFEGAGVLVWSGGLRFDGGEPVNARLLLHDPKRHRLDDLRLAWSLGQPLRGHVLVIAAPRHTPGHKRPERVALTRLAHAMGVPSLLIVEQPAALARTVKQITGALSSTDLATAVARAARGAPGLSLYGHGGMTPEQGQAFAKKALGASAGAGARAFKRRRLAEAVEHLEATLRHMAYLQDFKYLDGALLFLGQSYTLLKDYQRAIPVMQRLMALRAAAVDKARKAGKGVLGAQAKWVQVVKDMAWIRLRNEQYDEALAANRQAINLYHKVKRPLLALGSYEQRSIIAEKKKDNKLSLTYAVKTLSTAKRALSGKASASNRAQVAKAALRVARLQRMKFSNYQAATVAAKLSLTNIPEVKPEQRKEVEEKLAALGKQAKGKKGKAMAALKKQFKVLSARRKAIVGALDRRVGTILEIGRIQNARGDYNRAVARATEALELSRRFALPLDTPLLELVNNLYYLGAYGRALLHADEGLKQAKRNPLRKIQFYNAKGSVYAALGRTDQALPELKAALAIAVKLDKPSEQAASHNNLGNALRLAGRFEQAQAEFRKAVELDRKQEDKLGLAFDYANLGLTEELMGRTRDARRHLNQAIALSEAIGAPLNKLKALAGLGRMQLGRGEARAAQARFRTGQDLARKLGLRNWIWRFRLLTARALRKLGQPAQAEAQLRQGLAIIEQRPPRIRKAPDAPKVGEEPEDLYDELVDLTASQNRAERAFDLAERGRARSLIDLVSQNAALLPHKEAAEAMGRITTLQLELETARTARTRARRAGAAREQAEKEISRVEKALADARTALAALSPHLPPLVALDVQPLAKLRPLLKRHPKTVFVSYASTAKRLVIFTLAGDAPLSMQVVKLGRAALTKKIARFRRALVSYHDVQAEARELYKLLLAPALTGRSGRAERLVIVPSGPLHVLPFVALHDGKDYLAARHTISSLPSLNALRRLPGGPRPPGRRVAFGWAGGGRAPLTFTGREAAALGQTFADATVLQGAEATKARFLEEAPRAALLHIATHASFRPDAPLLSALELSDGELPVLEVLGLKLQRPLVLLSACETGLGVLAGADGIVGLQRAFLAAGAERVLASLWRVSDLGSALLIKHLLRRLAAGDAPALALRRAQNTVRKRYSHPAFWAGFRLDGAP